MTAAIRSELRKFFSTRMWWGMALAVFLSGAAFAALFAIVFTLDTAPQEGAPTLPDDPLTLATNTYTGGVSVGYLITLSIGILVIGSEYRHKTITGTFLATPRRGIVMGAKVVSLLLIGLFYGLVSLAGSVGAGATLLAARGHEAFPDPQIWRTLALALLVLGLWALIGLGAGILIPNQIAALLIAVGVAWIIEPIAGVLLEMFDWGRSIAPYLPSKATQAALDQFSPMIDGSGTSSLLPWWGGALVLLGYAAVMTIAGTVRTLRADIS